MGEKLLSVSLMTLLMFFAIEWFYKWYGLFLSRRPLTEKLRRSVLRVFWVLLSTIFWLTLSRNELPDEFTITHFSFSLFIFSLFGLLKSLRSVN